MSGMNYVSVIDHPLAQVALTTVRDKRSKRSYVACQARQAALLLVTQATSGLQVKKGRVQTPLGFAPGFKLLRSLVVMPVLRAGLSLVEPVLELLPDDCEVCVHHVGLERNEKTAKAGRYYPKKLRKIRPDQVRLIVDPMLSTVCSAPH